MQHQAWNPTHSTITTAHTNCQLAPTGKRTLLSTMSEKRPATGDPSGGQLVVKRQNVGTSRALTRQGASGSGALIQTVCDGYRSIMDEFTVITY